MKKYFLTKLNFLLGALSLGLAGCHSAKNAVNNDVTPVTVEPAPQKPLPEPLPEAPQPAPNPNEPTPVKYGVPWSE